MTNKNDRLVVAYFPGTTAAEDAADRIKDWDHQNDDIKLGAIGVITLDEHSGKLEVHEVGQRNTKKFALWGTAIGAAAGILTAGIALIPGMIVGAAVGGGIGALDHKNLGMTDEDVVKMTANLRSGGAALGVMCDEFEVIVVQEKLEAEGGTVHAFSVDAQAAEAVTAAAAAQRSASQAVADAVAEVQDDVETATQAVTAEIPDLAPESVAAVSGLVAATGVSAKDAASLHQSGVEAATSLLEQGATPAGRQELAEATGLDQDTILVAVKKLDLMRINGVGVKYATLLIVSGVETVPDLARRNAANLAAKMAEVNEKEAVVEELPAEGTVADWVEQANDLPRMITY